MRFEHTRACFVCLGPWYLPVVRHERVGGTGWRLSISNWMRLIRVEPFVIRICLHKRFFILKHKFYGQINLVIRPNSKKKSFWAVWKAVYTTGSSFLAKKIWGATFRDDASFGKIYKLNSLLWEWRIWGSGSHASFKAAPIRCQGKFPTEIKNYYLIGQTGVRSFLVHWQLGPQLTQNPRDGPANSNQYKILFTQLDFSQKV